jgi:hypothetical protein
LFAPTRSLAAHRQHTGRAEAARIGGGVSMFVPRSQFSRAANPFRSFSGPFFHPDADPGDPPVVDPPERKDPPADPLAGLTDEQKQAVQRIAAAARKDGEKDGRTKAETALEEAKRLAKEEADRQKLIDAGEFDKVRQELEGKVTAVSGANETLAQENADLREAITPLVEALRKELTDLKPEAVKDEPADLSPVQALKWLTARKKLLADLGLDQPQRPQIPGPAPRPVGRLTPQQVVENQKKELAASGKYGI